MMNTVLVTLDTNGNTLWSTFLPFENNITGLAIAEEVDSGSTVVVVASTSCLAFVRNGVLSSSTPGSYGSVVVIRDGVIVTVRNNDEVAAYHLSTEEWMWSVKVPQGPFLTQASIGGGEVAIGTPGFVLLVDLQTGLVLGNFSSVSTAVVIFDVAVSQDLLVISGTNENGAILMATTDSRGRNAYPSILSAYRKTNTSAPIWQYNNGATQSGVTIDDATEQVSFATAQSLVVLNLNTGAILGKMTKVQDYRQADRPAIAANGAVLFTGGLHFGLDMSLISAQVKR